LQVEHLTVLEYFGRKRADPKSVLSIMGSALDYARILLQLKQCKFEVQPAPTIHAQPSAVQVGVTEKEAGNSYTTSKTKTTMKLPGCHGFSCDQHEVQQLYLGRGTCCNSNSA
jgi:hypothetical protein